MSVEGVSSGRERAGEVVLWLATAAALVVCGAGSYEHAVVVPAWTSEPPASLAMFQGPYALDFGRWWRTIHVPTLLLELGALWLLRAQARRRLIAGALGVYAVVLAVSVAWYVPELLALVTDPQAAIPPAEWKARAERWEALSLARLAVLFAVGLTFVRAVAAGPRAATAPRPR